MTHDSNFAIMSQIAGQAKMIKLAQMLLWLTSHQVKDIERGNSSENDY